MPYDPTKQQISGGLYQPVPGAFNPVPPPPTGVNVRSTSFGTPGGTGFGVGPVPDVSLLPPGERSRITDVLAGLAYTVPGGGYLMNPADPQAGNPNSYIAKFGPLNANSYYMKYGGSDPAANRMAREVYNILGRLPTIYGGGTTALRMLGQQPGTPVRHGPSLEELLGTPYEGPWRITSG